MGFLGYEFIHDVEPVVPFGPEDELGTPTLYFLIADELLIFDRVAQTLTVLVNAVIEPGQEPAEAYENAVEEIDRPRGIAGPARGAPPGRPAAEGSPAPFVSNTTWRPSSPTCFVRRNSLLLDIIQMVGSQRFTAPLEATPFDLYRAARSINPSPYMFLLELDGFSPRRSLPELHVRCVDRHVEIRPIAGTRHAGRIPRRMPPTRRNFWTPRNAPST